MKCSPTVLLWVLLVLGAGSGCRPDDPAKAPPPPNQAPTTNRQVYAVRGVVQEVRPADRMAIIDHEEIPGFMEAMRMPFDVKDTNELAGLEPGHEITFDLVVTPDEGWMEGVRIVGRKEPPPPREEVRKVRFVEPLAPGDLLPDYPFTNQLGKRFTLSEFRGKALGLTFFFTRCPYPNFCPRMSKNFAEASRQLEQMDSGPTNWHLISLSFDPDNDTPEVLRHYGQQFGQDPNRWTLATGDMVEIDAITEQFGLMFGRDGEFFSHNSRTVIVDRDGQVLQIIQGNTWSVTDFVAGMVTAARGATEAGSARD